MKATLIISIEYKYNQPSVFIMAGGQYYGCLIYPQGRNFPSDVNYWNNATCSDSDRYFTVKEVEYSETVFDSIKNLQSEINETEKCLKSDNSNPWIPRPECSKNSKEYKSYLAKKDEQEKAQRERFRVQEYILRLHHGYKVIRR